MPRQKPKLDAAAANTVQLARMFAASVAPNEQVENYNYAETKDICRDLATVIEDSSRENLISNLNEIVDRVGLSALEHNTASRGTLVASIQVLEIINSIKNLQSAARAAGYVDPDIPDIDLQSNFSKEFVGDVRRDLNEVKALVERLENKVTRDGKSGVSLSLGPVSVDISVLMNVVRDRTEDALDYVSANGRVNAKLLREKLKDVNRLSNDIFKSVSQRAKLFGSRIFELSSRLARAAAHSYMTGLKLINSNIEALDAGNGGLSTGRAKDVGMTVDADIKADQVFSSDTRELQPLITEIILGYKAGVSGLKGRQKLIGQLITLRLIDGNSGFHAAFIIASSAGGTFRLTLPLTQKTFNYLKHADENTLQIAAYKAYERVKDGN